jgi:hypothetical protein
MACLSVVMGERREISLVWERHEERIGILWHGGGKAECYRAGKWGQPKAIPSRAPTRVRKSNLAHMSDAKWPGGLVKMGIIGRVYRVSAIYEAFSACCWNKCWRACALSVAASRWEGCWE